MPPFISPESVKELNEVMCVTKDNWTPIPMYCSNCGALLYGYRNDEGKITARFQKNEATSRQLTPRLTPLDFPLSELGVTELTPASNE